MILRAFATSAVLASLFLVGCSSGNGDAAANAPTGTASSGVCGAASDWKNKCSASNACDDTIISACSDVTSLLNSSLLDSAKACMAKASCGSAPTTCLAKAITSAKPTDAHKALAKGFCSCLVTGASECEAAIDSNEGAAKAALTIALPLSDDLAVSITDSCTGTLGCSATFSACAQGVVAKKLAETLSTDAATCLAKSVLDGAKDAASGGDDGSSDDGSGDPSCTKKTCDDYAGACGDHDNGCGGTVNCGKCASACTPKTCAQLGKTCGTAPDGCGGTVSCGVCQTGGACTDANEPNNDKAGAKNLGEMTDSPDSSQALAGLTLADGDEDWFKIAVTDAGFDGNPKVDISITGNHEISIFYVCTNGGDASYCPDGATQDDTIGKGCRGTHDVALKTSCSGITDSGTAWVRVRKTASDSACTAYSLTATVQ